MKLVKLVESTTDDPLDISVLKLDAEDNLFAVAFASLGVDNAELHVKKIKRRATWLEVNI